MADSVVVWFFVTTLAWIGLIKGAIIIVNEHEKYKRESSSDIW